MSEVSCRATAFMLDALQRRGVESVALLQGSGLAADRLSDASQSLSWNEFVDFLDRIDTHGGPSLLEDLGGSITEFRGNLPLRMLARFLWTELQFYRLLVERLGPGVYRDLSFDFDALPDGRCRMTLRIPETERGSVPLMHFMMGVMRAVPRFLGGKQAAHVETRIEPHLGIATITPTRELGFIGRSARALGGVLVGGAAFDELERRRRSAQRTTAELEARNRSLATFQAVANSITQSLDFAGTADRIVNAVLTHTDLAGVTLYTVSEAEDFLELAAARTPAGDGRHAIPARVPRDEGISWRAIRTRCVLWSADAEGQEDLHPEIRQQMRNRGLSGYAVVPLLFHDRAVGTLGLARAREWQLSAEEEESLLALGRCAAAALMSARHVARIEREVHERSRAEDDLRQSEERLRQVAENVDGIFYLVDIKNEELLYVSPNFERVTGWSTEWIHADPLHYYEMIHPDDRERVYEASRGEDGPRDHQIEYRLQRQDGTVREVIERATLLRDEHGEAVRITGFAQDVTERRELERQLRHSQKMEAIGRLAGGIAHDFNNLLTVILGYGTTLREHFEPEDEERETANEILRAGERAAALTRRLLTLARKEPVRLRVLDLAAVVRELLPMLESVVGENVAMTHTIDPEAEQQGRLRVRADRGQLEQVLVNLAVNARDAMPDGGAISIELAPLPSGNISLCVRDTGVGMDREVQALAFEPFFSTKGPGRGTGLGLATVHGIVEQAGGLIHVDSAPGEGASFEIQLPGVFASLDPEGPVALDPARRGDETLLLVEDQDAVREVAARALRERGYRVIEARDGHEALRRASEEAIELLVTDVVMPHMKGTELADRLTKERPDLPVLFISGYTGHDLEDPLAPPTDEVLTKPFTPKALAAAVRAKLDGRAPSPPSPP